jgi:threonine dehydratase
MTSFAISLDHIQAAAKKLEGQVARTPTRHSPKLSELLGAEIWLKLENMQYVTSFKQRGAYVKLSELNDDERKRGVIAVSAGNHAQGVAYNAQKMEVPATIVMPQTTPFTKVRQTRRYGAEVVLVEGNDLAAAAPHAEALQTERGLTFVHPYDDPAIMAGQGTVALEMLEDGPPDLDYLVVPIGGGGLISGMAIAAKALNPQIEIIGVEARQYPSAYQALRGIDATSGGVTLAEGIAVKHPGALTLPVIDALVRDILLVDELAMESAIRTFVDLEKTVVEGAGAAALAAVEANRERFRGQKVGIVVSGGSIDSRLLSSVLLRGLVRRGQLVHIRVHISDAPGVLAQVASLVGDCGGNIVDVAHQRLFHSVPIKMTDLDMTIETRGPEHVDEILRAFRKAGFEAALISRIEEGDLA